jgi:hypothetical protein
MIRHEIKIVIEEDIDSVSMEIVTPETLRMVEVVGYLETVKKQYIESKHATGPTIYQAPDTDNYDPRRGE